MDAFDVLWVVLSLVAKSGYMFGLDSVEGVLGVFLNGVPKPLLMAFSFAWAYLSMQWFHAFKWWRFYIGLLCVLMPAMQLMALDYRYVSLAYAVGALLGYFHILPFSRGHQ